MTTDYLRKEFVTTPVKWYAWWLVAVAMVACTSAPHVEKAAFHDAWGDRGPQVFARDVAWCADAVESRRSLWGGCMQQRGWLSSS